jgi:hypothetical protein
MLAILEMKHTRKHTHKKTHKKAHKKSHRRRHTRKYKGGRGGMGGAELGHAYTTGASQELYQLTGKTPGLSS